MNRVLRFAAALASTSVVLASLAAAQMTAQVSDSVSTVTLPSAPAPAPGGDDARHRVAAVPTGYGFTPVGTPVNILVTGSDRRSVADGGKYGDPAIHDSARADTAMVVHLSADRSWAAVVSVPRDTVMRVPFSAAVCGGTADRSTRINEAFTAGGLACTTAAVSALTRLPIDHAVSIDFGGFTDVVDRLGGMTVCLSRAVTDTDAQLALRPGRQRVTGEQALALMRARKSLADGSDLARSARQQYLVKTLLGQVKREGFTDPVKAWSVITAVTSLLTVDDALARPQTLLDAVGQLSGLSPAQLFTVTLPVRPDPDNLAATVVPDTAAVARLVAGLNADVNPASAPGSPSPATSGPGAPTRPSTQGDSAAPDYAADTAALFC